MIITITEKNAHLYNALFAEAYQALDAKGLIRLGEEKSEGRFTSIEEYFSYMEDLLALNKSKYMMLPIDEAPFIINANTRTITAPKIVVLQNDQVAEMVIFTIDRYFDYMDLYNAEIYVQWTLPDGKTEGATKVEFKDLETEPGKIRFAWPLDSEITEKAGQVKYSVRFWIKGEINGEDKVVYSFNTLPSTLTISPALQLDINPEDKVNSPLQENIFKRAIRNSQNSGIHAIPLNPTFGEPGLNLPIEASLVENTLTLKAQAIAGDTGELAYEWYYIPATTETISYEYEQDGEIYVTTEEFIAGTEYPYSDYTDAKGQSRLGFHVYGGTVENNKFEAVDPKEYENGLVIGEIYYVQDDSGNNPLGFKAYSETEVPSSNITLYQRFTTYTVPYSGEADTRTVTGRYCVKAINMIGSNKSNPASSAICRLVSPDEIVIEKDIPATKITDGNTEIKIVTKKQTSTAASMTYVWKRATKKALFNLEDGVEIVSAAGSTLTLIEPGWYKVDASVLLNRETKSAASGICKATFAPSLPTMVYDLTKGFKYGPVTEAGEVVNYDIPTFSGNAKEVVLKINMSWYNEDPEDSGAISKTYKNYATALFSEGITCTWTVKSADNNAEQIVSTDKIMFEPETLLSAKNNLTTSITVDASEDDTKIYTCHISNELNGQIINSKEVGEEKTTLSLSFKVQ